MALVKRISLFLAINLAIVLTISLLLSIFNIQPYLTKNGLNLGSLMAFCLIWGMVGSFISLLLSKVMAKWLMGVEIINTNTNDTKLQGLLYQVHYLARKASLPTPEVGVYNSADINAFATGPSKKRALVAVSSGLLQHMNQDELEGVIAHELSHISNGDMVTITLLQGVVNAFVMFLARVLAYFISNAGKNKRSSSSSSFYLLTFIFEIIFMILGSMIIASFSRYREFRADAGGAAFAGKQKMISALQSLQDARIVEDQTTKQKAFQSFKISNRSNVLSLFASHPPIEKRIKRLKESSF